MSVVQTSGPSGRILLNRAGSEMLVSSHPCTSPEEEPRALVLSDCISKKYFKASMKPEMSGNVTSGAGRGSILKKWNVKINGFVSLSSLSVNY